MICTLALCFALADPVPRLPACVKQTFISTGKHARKFTYRNCLTKFPDRTYIRVEGM